MLALREATTTDIPDMHRIRVSMGENRLRDASRPTPDIDAAYLRTGGAGNTWAAMVDWKAVGFATARIAGQDIRALFVDPVHQGRGIGRALLDLATGWLFARGTPCISLQTAPGTRADGFYRRAGWERDDVAPNGDVRYRLTRSAQPAAESNRTSPC